ncbi:hypothetical protein QY049_12365 [Bradyrhizobium sp. WYCCWR 13022]|uniref:hypothetical protein n=1 Tax=unclassified Bradyrhizobium TaxID=2631580 RepID=UPI00263B0C11|nr:hypothetical protein [Bradyrhizobium sp. WYCCWR 13022]MDN4984022.1 hypothetical protein [Bradyrhizobium sp. WYCCWR 13022]
MLSRLISLLSRIPAVKWAFNRLRPLPHSGSIEVAQIAADQQATATSDISVRDESSLDTPAELGPVVVDEISVPSVEIASDLVDPPEVDPTAKLSADAEPEVVNEAPASFVEAEAMEEAPVCSVEEVKPAIAEQIFAAAAETQATPVETSGTIVDDEPVSAIFVEAEPVVIDEMPVVEISAEITASVVIEASVKSEPAPSVAAEIEPDVVNDLPPVAAVVAEETTTHAPIVAAHVETEPSPVSSAPRSPSAPKARAKIVEPADRAALIRQRWAETGVRMWNPRLHGTGEATLNIQGRIGLLAPEPGETMPRYDKLEFKLLGGQIVCEGVIVEAPAHAGQRSFTRLAEPRGADRTREPVRERRAALA